MILRLDRLEEKIGYEFKDKKLLENALMHSSYQSKHGVSNERMEFLGDRVLGLAICNYLYKKHFDCPEGILSKHLNYLVSKETCAKIARSIDLGKAVLMSSGEEKNNGRDKDTVLGDATEALIAAIYLDSNYDNTSKIILNLWKFLLEDSYEIIDSKSALQEWSQKNGHGIPEYVLKSRTGKDHNPLFIITVTINQKTGTGEGTSKRNAEQMAAKELLDIIGNKD